MERILFKSSSNESSLTKSDSTKSSSLESSAQTGPTESCTTKTSSINWMYFRLKIDWLKVFLLKVVQLTESAL